MVSCNDLHNGMRGARIKTALLPGWNRIRQPARYFIQHPLLRCVKMPFHYCVAPQHNVPAGMSHPIPTRPMGFSPFHCKSIGFLTAASVNSSGAHKFLMPIGKTWALRALTRWSDFPANVRGAVVKETFNHIQNDL